MNSVGQRFRYVDENLSRLEVCMVACGLQGLYNIAAVSKVAGVSNKATEAFDSFLETSHDKGTVLPMLTEAWF